MTSIFEKLSMNFCLPLFVLFAHESNTIEDHWSKRKNTGQEAVAVAVVRVGVGCQVAARSLAPSIRGRKE